MLTTDPIYWKPAKPYIIIQNLNKNATFYSYNGLLNQIGIGPATMIPIYCRVSLGTDHHGTFEVQFKNSDGTTLTAPPAGMINGNRCIIGMDKDLSLPVTYLISGFIRKTGYQRGIGGEALYTIEGSGAAIRMNERISYLVKEALKNVDGSINTSDTTMKANQLLTQLITTDISDSFTRTANEMTSNYKTTGLPASSDVENFLPSLAVEFGEYQDGINAIEDQSNGEFFLQVGTDTVFDLAQFKHQLEGGTIGRGFILKDSPGTDDNADITGYISANSPASFSESKYKSDGYSSRVWAILPAEERPGGTVDLNLGLDTSGSPSAWAYTKKDREYAYPFRPTHSHFIPGDIIIAGNVYSAQTNTAIATGKPPRLKFRICKDAGGFPMDVGGVVANVVFGGQFGDELVRVGSGEFLSEMLLLSQQRFRDTGSGDGNPRSSFDLDTSKQYWLISADDNFSIASQKATTFAWGLDDSVAPTSGGLQHIGADAGGTATMTTNSNGGNNWVGPLINKPCFAIGRYRSQSFIGWDPKAMHATGSGTPNAHLSGSPPTGTMIESTLSNAPSMIETRQAMYKYLASQLYYMARPRINWNSTTITPPNIAILPNDPLMIVDSTLNLSTAGAQVMVATTGDMTYEFGTPGGTGNVFSSQLSLSIQPAGIANHY